jgi:anti-sigma-K factor RskA
MWAMTELSGMSCAEFADVAAELALGVLTGRERADALIHLDHCDACREHVSQLTMTGEELLGLLPSREPPPGFETRVMARLGMAPAVTTAPFGKKAHSGTKLGLRSRRLLAAAAAVVALAGSAVGGWGLHAVTSPAPATALSSAALLTASHEKVGDIYVYNGNRRWMYMSVDIEATHKTGTVICQMEEANGQVINVGTFKLADGYGSWGSPAWTGGEAPVSARLLATDGTVLASATFPKA